MSAGGRAPGYTIYTHAMGEGLALGEEEAMLCSSHTIFLAVEPISPALVLVVPARQTPGNSYPGQLLPQATLTPGNSYPGQLLPQATLTPGNSYSGQLLPQATLTPGNSYPGQLLNNYSWNIKCLWNPQGTLDATISKREG